MQQVVLHACVGGQLILLNNALQKFSKVSAIVNLLCQVNMVRVLLRILAYRVIVPISFLRFGRHPVTKGRRALDTGNSNVVTVQARPISSCGG